MKRQFILLSIAFLLLSCGKETLRKRGYSVHGIDVSHYQKHIDWRAVAAQDIHFAFVKASEGVTMRDTFFSKNWDEMKAANIKRGAYHFFRPAVSAAAQAQNFVLSVNLEDGDLPPVLDVEVTDGVSEEKLREDISLWLRMVETVFQAKPILYTNQKFFNEHLAGYFPEHQVWIARYHRWRKPELQANHTWQFWQYGNRGRVSGIDGNVDFNVFKGTLTQLNAICLAKPKPSPLPQPKPKFVAKPAAVKKDLSTNP